MKRILEIFSILFIVSGLLFMSCSKQDTEPKMEGTTEKGVYGEKADDTMETVKETVSGYEEKAGEAMESAKETVEKAEEAIAESGEKAKEKVFGYTAPEKEAAAIEGEKAGDVMEKSDDTLK